SDESGVTYTEVSSLFEDLSDIGSPRADDHEHFELPGMLEDPYAPPLPDYVPGPEHADDEIVAEDASPTTQEPEYVPESDLEAYPEEDDDEDPEEDPVDYPADGGDDGDDEEGSSEDEEDGEDDDMDIEADEKEEEEKHPAPADSVVVALPATWRKLIPLPAWSDSEVVRLLAMSTPPSSPLSPLSSPPPRIPFPPLPSILSPPSLVLSPAASTSHSPPLPPPFILSATRSDAPSSGIPPPLPISAPTSSPPLQLPSASLKEDRLKVTLPPRKRLGITLGPGYEVGESSSVATVVARPAGGLRANYGFVATMDREIRRDSERELLAGRLNMLFRDRRAHTYTRHLMETEARLSREAWVRLMDASDLAHDEVMSLRTTVLGQMTKIRELHAADRRRQIVTSEMLRADHMRLAEIRGLRTADRTRQ
nr:hypothetical protein [Tanacetum cinerariifolium]